MNKNILRTALVAAVLATAAGNAAADDGVLELGNFTNADMTYTGSSWENAPVNLYYKYSGGQIIYPASMLTEIADVNSQIKSLTFKLKEDGMIYSDLTFDMTMYAEMIDTDRIGEKDASTYNFLPYSTTGSKATLSCTHEPLYIDFLENYSIGWGEISIPLGDDGFRYEVGKSLLITVTNESLACLDGSEYPQFLKYNTTEERTATFSSMYVPFADAIADNPYVYPGSYADYNYYSYMSDKNQPSVRILSEQKHFDAITAPAIDAPDADAPVEYFNLQGVKVTNPSGLVIRRQGNHTTKVLIP